MENSNKRLLEDGCQYPHTETKTKAARFKTTISHPKSSKKIIGFQDLSDEIILYLFKYLSHDNLAKMALICPNLFRVSRDFTLWKTPRFEKFEKSMEDVYLRYLNEDTTELFISCNDVPSSDYSVSHKFLIQLETKCPQLLHLTLTNQVLDAGEISVKILPRKLKTLTIDNTTIENVPDSSSYLRDISKACPDLERIIMTNNDWVLPNYIRAFSKLERLSYLSLAGCKQLKDDFLYRSIDYNTFQPLQTVDLRFTPVSNQELGYFNEMKNLKHVFLERPEYIKNPRCATITDLGLARFCAYYFVFRYPYSPNEYELASGLVQSIETIYVRNYPQITDAFLKIAAIHFPDLKLLDITGSGCTLAGIENYKAKRSSTKLRRKTVV